MIQDLMMSMLASYPKEEIIRKRYEFYGPWRLAIITKNNGISKAFSRIFYYIYYIIRTF